MESRSARSWSISATSAGSAMAASASRTIWSSFILQTARRIAERIASETGVPSWVRMSSACRVSSSARKLICVADVAPGGAFLAWAGGGAVGPVLAGAVFALDLPDLAAAVDLVVAAVVVAGSAAAALGRYVRLRVVAFLAAVAVAGMSKV